MIIGNEFIEVFAEEARWSRFEFCSRTRFAWCCIVRAINTTDVMTCTVENIPFELMCHITDRITHEVPGINRVLYDFTPKPTGTVEFE